MDRTPATGVGVRIHDDGYTVSHWGVSVSVASEDVGGAKWRRHVHGATRETDVRHRDDRRRRPQDGGVPHGHEAPGREDLALEARVAAVPPARQRRRRHLPRPDAAPGHLDHDRPGPDPRRRGQGRHARGSALGSRGGRLRLAPDARARRRGPAPPLRHRPSGHAPSRHHGDDDGSTPPSSSTSPPASSPTTCSSPTSRAAATQRSTCRPAGRPPGERNNGNVIRQATYYHVAGSSEPGSYTWTWTGTQPAAGGMSAYYGVKASAPLDAVGPPRPPTTPRPSPRPRSRPRANDALVLAFFSSGTNSTYSTGDRHVRALRGRDDRSRERGH